MRNAKMDRLVHKEIEKDVDRRVDGWILLGNIPFLHQKSVLGKHYVGGMILEYLQW
jgi:hypothetical protein